MHDGDVPTHTHKTILDNQIDALLPEVHGVTIAPAIRDSPAH